MSTEPYCFWDAKSREDTFVLIAHTFIASSVFLLSIFRLLKFRRVYNLSQDKYINICVKIHILTLLWALTFLVEYIYSISMFFAELNQDPLPKDISPSSKIFAILNKIPNFIVQTIIFQILVFNYQGFYDKIKVQNFKINHNFYRFYIHYIFKARLVLHTLALLSLIIFSNDQQIWTTSKINIIFEISDSVIIAAILIYSLISFLREGIQKNESLFDENIRDEIKTEYYMMIVSDILGIVTSCYFLIYKPYFTDVNKISCMEQFGNHMEFFIGYNIVGKIVKHFVPILWFLKMYNYKNTGVLRSYIQDDTQQNLVTQNPLIVSTH